MKRLVVVEAARDPLEPAAFPDADALRVRGGTVVVAVRQNAGRFELADDVHRLALDGRRDPRNLVREARRDPRAAAKLAFESRNAPETRDAPVQAFVRHLPFVGVDVDIVHFSSVKLATSYPLLGWLLDAAVVVTCTEADLDRIERSGPPTRVGAVRALTSAAGLHCLSADSARRVEALTSGCGSVRVEGPAVPSSMLRSPPVPAESAIEVVAVSPLTAESGIEQLLVALADVRASGADLRLRIVGDGPLRDALRWAVDDLGLTEVVELLGDANATARWDALASAHVAVAIRPVESATGALVTAMALGLAVVDETGGDAPFVEDGVDGLVVDAANAAARVSALRRLAADPALRRRLGDAARARVAHERTLDAQAERFDHWYAEVLADRLRPRPGASSGAPPLRVARYARTFPKKPGLVRQSVGLMDVGVDVHVFAGSPSVYADRFPDLLGREELATQVHYLHGARHSPWRTIGAWGEVRRASRHPRDLARFVADNWRTRRTNGLGFWRGTATRLAFVGRSFDVFHVESDTWAFDVADLAAYLRCPVLLGSLATIQRTSVASRGPDAYAQLFALADGYHFVSEYVRANTVALGLTGVPTWVEPPGVDTTIFAPPPVPRVPSPASLRVLMVGRLSWEKGYDWGLEALAIARRAGTVLECTIAGGGPEERAVRAAIGRLGLDDVVRCAGNLGIDALVAEYHRADVLLHAAVDEAFGVAILEAQATGLPVVTTDAGGLPEAVVDGETGFVVHRRDPDALAEKLSTLAGDPSLRRTMGTAARTRVVQHHDVRDGARRMAAIYSELVAGRGLPRCSNVPYSP